MASNDVNLGIGYSGMMYIGEVGTATIPTSPMDTLTGFTEVGAIDSDGITVNFNKDAEPIRDWSKAIRRLASSDEGATISGKLLETTKKVFEAIFGADNVTYTAATANHGNITSVTVAPGVSASKKVFYFLMKDGDDMLGIGGTGILRDLGEVSFVPNQPITYDITIELDSITYTKDDGQVNS